MAEMPFLEPLRKHLFDNLPFVAYRKPDETNIVAFLQETDELYHVKDFSETGFVFAPFDDKRPAVLIPEKGSKNVIFEGYSAAGVNADGATSEASLQQKDDHIKLVQKALQKLQTGQLKKVVLSRKETVELHGKKPLELFIELLTSYPTAFVYIFFHPKIGLWLGATPETLLKTGAHKFMTMALAGTQKYLGNKEVSWGEKEREEQQFVTDAIVTELGKTKVKNLTVSKPYTAQAGTLLHLRTDISGDLPGKRTVTSLNSEGKENGPATTLLGEIITSLHPTPAVCGLPKKKAKEFIILEEKYDREFYTGFLGELNLQKNTQRSRNKRNVENLAFRTVKKESALFVNLRCMKVENDTAYIYVGGGITKESDPNAEWQETVNKSQTMKKVLLKT